MLLIPGLLVALIRAHMALVVKQKHTQFPGPGRTNENVVGERMFPRFAAKAGGFFMIVFGVIALLGGVLPDQPDLVVRPVRGRPSSPPVSQPDWYVMFLDGSTRLMPAWEITSFGDVHACRPLFWPTVVLPGVLVMLPLLYPFIEARLPQRQASPHLLQRPRDVPARTGLGRDGDHVLRVLTLSGGNDVIAQKFDISLNAMTWAGRIGLLILPPLAYYVTYRSAWVCSSTTARCSPTAWRRASSSALPDGRFVEVHQPLAPSDGEHHAALEYQGAPVPKKMNKIGAVAPAVRGFLSEIEGSGKEQKVPPVVSPRPSPPAVEDVPK